MTAVNKDMGGGVNATDGVDIISRSKSQRCGYSIEVLIVNRKLQSGNKTLIVCREPFEKMVVDCVRGINEGKPNPLFWLDFADGEEAEVRLKIAEEFDKHWSKRTT